MLNKIKIAEHIPANQRITNDGLGVYIFAPRSPGFYSLNLLVNDQHKCIGWKWEREQEAVRR